MQLLSLQIHVSRKHLQNILKELLVTSRRGMQRKIAFKRLERFFWIARCQDTKVKDVTSAAQWQIQCGKSVTQVMELFEHKSSGASPRLFQGFTAAFPSVPSVDAPRYTCTSNIVTITDYALQCVHQSRRLHHLHQYGKLREMHR